VRAGACAGPLRATWGPGRLGEQEWGVELEPDHALAPKEGLGPGRVVPEEWVGPVPAAEALLPLLLLAECWQTQTQRHFYMLSKLKCHLYA
jgi:hypothetical protein